MDIFDAIRKADVEAVKDLLSENQGLVHARVEELQWTPLHLVAAHGCDTKKGHEEIAKLLLACGAEVNARDIADQTPLHLIAINGSRESVQVARILLENGADVRAKGPLRLTPLGHWQHGKEIHDLLWEYMKRKA